MVTTGNVEVKWWLSGNLENYSVSALKGLINKSWWSHNNFRHTKSPSTTRIAYVRSYELSAYTWKYYSSSACVGCMSVLLKYLCVHANVILCICMISMHMHRCIYSCMSVCMHRICICISYAYAYVKVTRQVEGLYQRKIVPFEKR